MPNSTCSALLWCHRCQNAFRVRDFYLLRCGFPTVFYYAFKVLSVIHNPGIAAGLGSSHFARRYFENRCFFLFLRLLRCFSSPGSPPCVMDWRMDDRGLLCRVSPFGDLRINGYLHLPAAFRSLSRLSSALSAKASTLRSFRFLLFCHKVSFSSPYDFWQN